MYLMFHEDGLKIKKSFSGMFDFWAQAWDWPLKPDCI